MESGFRSDFIISVISRLPNSHNGSHDTQRIHLANAVVIPVCNVQVTFLVQIDSKRIFQKGIGRRAKIPAKLRKA